MNAPSTASEEAPQLKRDVVPSQYRTAYKATGGTNGDFLAQLLQTIGKDGLPALHAVMKENGIPEKKWSAHNPGQQRMNLSNVLRSRFLKGEDVTILGKQYNIKHMADDYNGPALDKGKPGTVKKFAETINIKTDERTLGIVTKTFFPPEKAPKKTAEQRAADKAEGDRHKAEAKAQAKAARDAAKADKKAAKDADKAAAKAKRDAEKAAKAAKAK